MPGAGGEDNKQKSQCSYFKVGFPTSWAGGLLNRISVLRAKVDENRCQLCGVCDKACYVAQFPTDAACTRGAGSTPRHTTPARGA